MYDALQHSFATLDDKPDVKEHELTFMGFDGNNETRWMTYAAYFCRPADRRFENLKKGSDGFNSHMPTRDMYRRQLREWNQSGNKYKLTAEEIKRIAEAAMHPSRRNPAQ